MEKIKKKELTRDKILTSARKVFAKHSYGAASIRMIASEGGFDFGLIRYHFNNKADLFETIMKQVCDELYLKNKEWMEGIEEMRPEDGFSLYIDRFLKYNFDHPETLGIFMNNIYLAEDPELEIPGYSYLPKALSLMRETFEQNTSMNASRDEIYRFVDSFNAQVLMFAGASSCNAKMLNLEPRSKEYRLWVKNTLMYIFLPHLKRLLFK
ncbi:TetR/AcrR family transcriptional regulator [Desulfobacula sp.]